ncbi:MAG: polyhydroxyalkanoate synthesis repressor PhaR [Aquabacterium sp.]|nr:MAG: polyhydroxyalkanoate synthesis repressor PhaR [Aquabacterium sp.]
MAAARSSQTRNDADEAPEVADKPQAAAPGTGPRLLKKYPNRRLYDSRSSSYITLADVKRMVLACEDFLVIDAKSTEDITRSILLQIILEEESGGVPTFSKTMLANIIRFYGHSMQGLMGSYLEKNLLAFVDMQNKFTQQTAELAGGKAFGPEVWTQFMQAPWMQGLMGNYVEQSRNIFQQMQEQMQKQAQSLFPFGPGAENKDK